MSLKSLISLDSPLRVFYHYVRGIVASFLYGNPSKDMVIIGITGTKGKSTVTNIITKGLIDSGKKVFMFSTVNYCIAGEWYENNMKMTSPSPFILQKLLKQAKDAGCEYAVIETSSHAIFYHRIYGIDYDTAVLTNISQDHLDLHKTMENYVATKLKLFQNLVLYKRKPGIKKVSVINIDSPQAALFMEPTVDTLYTYGLGQSAQIRAQNIRYKRTGTEFEIKMPSNVFALKSFLRGEFNVYNILAAVSVLVSQKVSVENITSSIASIESIPGRLEEVSNNFGFTIFVDYAHTEESLRSVLETVRNMEGTERIITVFWATGDRDKSKRPKMWKVVDTLSDVVILTEDDNYSENGFSIIRDVSVGIKRKEGEDFWIVPSREDAIRTALVMAHPGDVVIIAGKGAETVLATNQWFVPWHDPTMARKILQEMEENAIVSI